MNDVVALGGITTTTDRTLKFFSVFAIAVIWHDTIRYEMLV